MSRYVGITRLKNLLTKKVEKSKRQKIKDTLSFSNLVEEVISNNEDVVFGPDFTFGLDFDFIKKVLDFIDFDELRDIKIPYIENDHIFENVKIAQKEDFFKKLNHHRKSQVKKEEKKKIKENDTKKENIKNEKNIINIKELFKTKVGMCLDIEMYEKDQSIMTEIGITIIKNGKLESVEHLIIKENYKKRNGKYVEDNKDNFNFGESVFVTFEEGINRIICAMKESDIIFGHGIYGDFKFLRQSGVFEHEEIIKTKEIVNTLKITSYLSNGKNKSIGLENALNLLEINHKNLHNAGNDSYYNWIILESIMEKASLKHSLQLTLKGEDQKNDLKRKKMKLK